MVIDRSVLVIVISPVWSESAQFTCLGILYLEHVMPSHGCQNNFLMVTIGATHLPRTMG